MFRRSYAAALLRRGLKTATVITALATPWEIWWLRSGEVARGTPLWLWLTLGVSAASTLLIVVAMLRSSTRHRR